MKTSSDDYDASRMGVVYCRDNYYLTRKIVSSNIQPSRERAQPLKLIDSPYYDSVIKHLGATGFAILFKAQFSGYPCATLVTSGVRVLSL